MLCVFVHLHSSPVSDQSRQMKLSLSVFSISDPPSDTMLNEFINHSGVRNNDVCVHSSDSDRHSSQRSSKSHEGFIIIQQLLHWFNCREDFHIIKPDKHLPLIAFIFDYFRHFAGLSPTDARISTCSRLHSIISVSLFYESDFDLYAWPFWGNIK